MAKQQKFDEILDAAVKTFLRYGFKKTTLEDVADALGMTKSSIYHYFNNKEELLQESIRKIFKNTLADYKNIFNADNTIMVSYFKMYELFLVTTRQYSPGSIEIAGEMPEVFPIMRDDYYAFHTDLVQIMTDRLEQEVEKGRLKPLPAKDINTMIVLIFKNYMMLAPHTDELNGFPDNPLHFVSVLLQPYLIH